MSPVTTTLSLMNEANKPHLRLAAEPYFWMSLAKMPTRYAKNVAPTAMHTVATHSQGLPTQPHSPHHPPCPGHSLHAASPIGCHCTRTHSPHPSAWTSTWFLISLT